MKPFWLTFGIVSLLLGILGIALPLLPTVPFVLLSAYCFSRSSERLHHWLVNHPTFGPAIIDWRERGAISLRAKRLATLSVVAVLLISLYLDVSAFLLLLQFVILLGVLLFIWTRPQA